MHPSALVKWRIQRCPFGIHQNRYRLSRRLSLVLCQNNSAEVNKNGKLLDDLNFFYMTEKM